ncbi:MAG: acyl-CoA dehydrogenase family protein [Pseudomonadales bacterium]
MPEQLNKAQRALAEKATGFAHDVLLPLSDVSAGTPEEFATARSSVIRESKAAGFYAMTQPEEFGGSAASALELTIVRDALASTNAPFMGAVFGPGPGVLAGVGEPLKSSHLAPLLAGEIQGAFGFTEADDASPTTAERKDGYWLINGHKSYVTGGEQADFINTLVTISDAGPAMIVIDTRSEGVTIEKTFGSLDGSHHAVFRFSDVHVPIDHVIGKPGEGLPRAMRQIGDVRLSLAALCVGYMRWIDDYLTNHLQQPGRTGEPRGNKEGIRLRYADNRIQTFAARSMVYRTARLADSGANVVNEGIACKVFATEAVAEVVDTAIQLVGGSALITGHPLESLYRRVRALRLAEGGSDVLRLNLARGSLDLDKGIL